MTRRARLVLALLLAAAVIVAALAVVFITRLNTRTYPPAIPSGELTFTANTRGTWDVALYANDSGLTLLTPDDEFQDYFPSWDFASERVNFLANRAPDGSLGPAEVYPDGSHLRALDLLSAVATLFFENRLDWDPSYAPNGTLVWSSLRDFNLELYTRAKDGEAARLTDTGARDWFATWSPDGTRIIFSSDRAGDENIFIVDADGSNLVQVTSDPADDVHPLWSLDSTQIAFVSERDGLLKDGALNLYVISTADALAGRGEDAVTPLDLDAPFEGDPRFSADGKQVAVMAREDGRWVARVMDIAADGTIIHESAHTISAGGDLLFPVWRPSGQE